MGVVEIKAGAKATRSRQAVCGEGRCKVQWRWTQARDGGEGRARVKGSMAHGPMACTSVHGSWDQHGTGSLREGRVKGEKGSILPSRRTQ